MNSIFFSGSHKRTGVLAFLVAALLAGCSSGPDHTASPPASGATAAAADFEAALARAATAKRPLIVLVAELGGSREDDNACALIESPEVKAASSNIMTVVLDIGISRNRATAGRFHLTKNPLLVCLTPKGVIVSRDEPPITKSLVLKRIAEVVQQAPGLDAKLAALKEAAGSNTNSAPAQFALADFLLAHQNALDAIPHLAAVAHSEGNAPALRVCAWVAMACAHLGIAEPEKCRHEAEALIATLGPRWPVALAGGNLVLGIQDANAKRTTLARREFEKAVAAAPESPYGEEAAAALVKLPKD